MAEASLKKLEEQITCSICLETYTEPKVLQCSHAYCKACLEKLVKAPDKTTLTCPTCRKPTTLTEKGVSGLEPAFYISYFFDIQESIKSIPSSVASVESSVKSSTRESLSLGDASLEEQTSLSLTKKAPMCPEHGTNELQLYCTTCQEVICFQCTIRKHNGHQYDLVGEVADTHREELSVLLRPVENKIAVVGEDLIGLDTRHREVSAMREYLKDNIRSVIEKVHKAVSHRETELIEELNKIAHGKLKCLEIERDRKEMRCSELCRCIKQVRDSMAASETEMLTRKKTLVKNIESMTSDEPSSDGDVDTNANMIFSVQPNFTQKWCEFGKILTPESIDPQQCSARGSGLEMSGVETTSVVYLKTNNYNGDPFVDPIPSLESELVLEKTGATEACAVDSKGQNLYEITYRPKHRGRHQLHIKINHQHITGSPFSLAVHTPFEGIKRPTSVKYDIPQPWAVAVNKRDEVIITEFNRHVVSIWKSTGEKIRSFGSYGPGQDQLHHPRGVAVDGDGNIFLVDSFNHRIKKYTSSGKFLAIAGRQGNGPLGFTDPKGIAFNTTNNMVYVADCNCIQILTSADLTFSGMFGHCGSMGKLSNPFSIASDSTGNVYIADKSNSNIQVYTPRGKFLRMFHSEGYSAAAPPPRKLPSAKDLWGSVTKGHAPTSAPAAIAIDDCDLVYVSDDYFHHISVLTCDGQRKAELGREGLVEGEFKRPRGIAVNSTGTIYVCDFENNRVQEF